MNNAYRLMGFIFLSFVTILFLNKGLELWSLGTNVDGDGIGIYFLGLEINDRVFESNIPKYAVGFFIGSFITLLVAIALICKTFHKNKSHKVF